MMPGFGTPLANQWFWLRHVWEARWRDHPLQGGLIICKHMMDSNGLWTLRWSTLQPLKQLTNGWVLSSMSSSIQLVLIIREYESVDHLLLKITTLSIYWKSPGYQLGRLLVHLPKTWKHHSGSSGPPHQFIPNSIVKAPEYCVYNILNIIKPNVQSANSIGVTVINMDSHTLSSKENKKW